MTVADVFMTERESLELSRVSRETAAVLAHIGENDLRRLLAYRRTVQAGLFSDWPEPEA